MEFSVRPRRSKVLRAVNPAKTTSTSSKCKVKSIASGAITPPRKGSSNNNNKSQQRPSLLRGSVKSLAIGSMTRKALSDTSKTASDSLGAASPAEVTVSLSRSSFLSSSSHSQDNSDPLFQDTQTLKPPLHLSKHYFSNNLSSPYAHEDETFMDPYLDYTRRRPRKEEPQIPQNHIVEDSLDYPLPRRTTTDGSDNDDDDDDFQTACDPINEESLLDMLVGPTPPRQTRSRPPTSPGRAKSLGSAKFPDHLLLSPRRQSAPTAQSHHHHHRHHPKQQQQQQQQPRMPNHSHLISPSSTATNTNNNRGPASETRSHHLPPHTTSPNRSMDSSTQDSRLSIKFEKEKAHWNATVTNRSMTLGAIHPQTAEALYSLGHAHLRLDEFREAMQAFQSCGKIWKALEGADHLSVARTLDAYGLAALRYHKSRPSALGHAQVALEKAFAIRFHNLGVWHVDTVESFNKLSSVKLYRGNIVEACKGYEEVFLLRKAIFGWAHPSVAVSAHGLAKVHIQLQHYDQATRYFQVALDIYRSMHLPKDHLTVRRLLQDWKDLDDRLEGRHIQRSSPATAEAY